MVVVLGSGARRAVECRVLFRPTKGRDTQKGGEVSTRETLDFTRLTPTKPPLCEEEVESTRGP